MVAAASFAIRLVAAVGAPVRIVVVWEKALTTLESAVAAMVGEVSA